MTAPVMDSVPEPIVDQPSRAIVVSLPRELARYARTQLRWRQGCTVTPLRDGGETFPAMLAAIASAKKSVSMETYILAADRIGERFKAALIERARAGVVVRLIYDAVGSFGLPASYVDGLRAGGVQVVDFNPIAPWRRRFRLSHRDHRKVIVVDDVVAFTGGLNIAVEYSSGVLTRSLSTALARFASCFIPVQMAKIAPAINSPITRLRSSRALRMCISIAR